MAPPPPAALSLDSDLFTGFTLALLALVLGAIARAVRAREVVRKKLQEDRLRVRAAIEAEHLVPALARVVVGYATSKPPPSPLAKLAGKSDPTSAEVADYLQRAAFVGLIAEVARLGADATFFDRVSPEIERVIRMQGAAAIIFGIGAEYLIFWAAERGVDLPDASVLLGYTLALSGLLTWLALFSREVRLGNQIEGLVRRYGL